MRKYVLVCGFIFIFCILCIGVHPPDQESRILGNSNSTKIDPALYALKGEAEFFVQFESFSSRDILLATLKVDVIKNYGILPLSLVSGTFADIAYLSSFVEVQSLTEDHLYHIHRVDINTTIGGLGVASGGIGEDYLHGLGYYGTGVTVAVVDTGIDATHPDLDDLDDNPSTTDPKVIAFSNRIAFPHSGWDDPAGDPNGHGTHCAGIISGTGSASSGTYVGIAPQTQLVAVKVLDENGDGYESDVISGIEYAMSRGDVDIISISLGGESTNPNDPLSQAVNTVWASGIVVTIASGNGGDYGYGTVLSPGMALNPITVGATDGSYVTGWSSRGFTPDVRIKPDVVAPGVSIISTIPSASQIAQENPFAIIHGTEGDYIPLSGTSMATPHVAGGCALLLQAFPSTTPNRLKVVVLQGAQNLGVSENVQGQGQIDLQGAYTLLNAGTYAKVFVTPTTYPQAPHTTTYGTLPPASNSFMLTCIPSGTFSTVRLEATGALAKYLAFSQITFPSISSQFTVVTYLDPPDIVPYGTQTAQIQVYDGGNMLLGTTTVSLTILRTADTVAPTITAIQCTPDVVEYATSPFIDALISDSVTGIAAVTLQYNVGGGWISSAMTLYPITTYYSGISGDPIYTLSASVEALIPVQVYGTLVCYRIVATDTYGNSRTSTESTYTVNDFTAPIIETVTRLPLTPSSLDPVTITATVTEPPEAAGIDEISLVYSFATGGWIEVLMAPSGSDQYEATIPAHTDGTVQYQVVAVDLAGQESSSSIYAYTLPLDVQSYGVTPSIQVRTASVEFSVEENDVATTMYATMDGSNYPLSETSAGHWSATYAIPSGTTLGDHSVTFTIVAPDRTATESATLTVEDITQDITWTMVVEQVLQQFSITTNYPTHSTVFYRVSGAMAWNELEGSGYQTILLLTTPVLLQVTLYEFYVRSELATGYFVERAIQNFVVIPVVFHVAWSITDNIRGAYANFPIHLVGQLNGYETDGTTDENGDVVFDLIGDIYTITLDDGINSVTVDHIVDEAEVIELAIHFTNAPPIVSDVVVSGYVQSYQSIEISFQVEDYNSLTDLQSITLILNSRMHSATDPDNPKYHYTAVWTWSTGWMMTPSDPLLEDLVGTYDPDADTVVFHLRITFPNCDDLEDWELSVAATDGEVTDSGETLAYSWVNGNAVLDILTAIVDAFVQLFRSIIGFLLPIFGVVLGVTRYRKTGALATGGIAAVGTLVGWFINPLFAFATGVASLALTFGGVGIGTLVGRVLRPATQNYCRSNPTAQVCRILDTVDLAQITVFCCPVPLAPRVSSALPSRSAERRRRSIL